ncbi:MAG: methionyl-tRNA formyltransferase [Treponema sp.]|jgi:methionyl-tRNA formyltransferase|nr:methionyl-tRNA formyltransferase [Treponema sp.]
MRAHEKSRFSGPPRILFAGSPAIALPSLEALMRGSADTPDSAETRPAAPPSGAWTLAGVLTNPDKPRGRSGRAEPTAVAAAAERYSAFSVENGLPPLAVLKPETLKAEAREAAAALSPDLLVSFAYGRIFGPKFLSIFPLGGINIHPSLLPAYRGASPVQEAILRRDGKTGICIQKIALETDTGNILASREIPLSGRETAASLGELAGKEAALLLSETLRGLLEAVSRGDGFPDGTPQEGTPSYCSLIGKDSGIIDWNKSAVEIDAMIRAYTPWPLARTSHNGQVLLILEAAPFRGDAPREDAPGGEAPGVSRAGNGGPSSAAETAAGRVLGTDKKNGILIQTGGGILAVTRLQYQARKALPWQAFLNGARNFIGARLDSEDA